MNKIASRNELRTCSARVVRSSFPTREQITVDLQVSINKETPKLAAKSMHRGKMFASRLFDRKPSPDLGWPLFQQSYSDIRKGGKAYSYLLMSRKVLVLHMAAFIKGTHPAR